MVCSRIQIELKGGMKMKNKRRGLALESKVDLVILTIGLSLIIWVTVTHKEVRKGYIPTADIREEYNQDADTVGNMPSYGIEGRITDRLESVISQELDIVGQNIEIFSVNAFEDSTIVTFMYNQGEDAFEGICQISQKEKVLFKDIAPVNCFEPFTLHEVEFKKDDMPGCTVIYGVVNNSVIKSININLYDKTIVNIVLGNEKSYSYINEDYSSPIMRVDGLDESLDIFYKWDKIYMNEV